MLVSLFIAFSLVLHDAESSHVTLNTRLGKITGLVTNVNGTSVSKFLGIPFAKPPVGRLRFVKPEPFGAFQVLNVTKYGQPCLQMMDKRIGDEDCLTLNIFTPSNTYDSSKKSVMVWIHGGGNDFGDAETYPGEILAALGNVVVVTLQYRLGVFGFLSTGNSILPGNLGLWDQHLALLWVKQNIEEYGGDSSSITIFGESAGGSNVAYQLFSPHNNASIFQRAILQSAWERSPDHLARDPLNLTTTFAESVNCSLNQDFVSCLQSKPATQLLEKYNKIPEVFKTFPIADGDFLPKALAYLSRNFTENPRKKMDRTLIGNFADYDVFGGWNDQEGIIWVTMLQCVKNMTTGKDLEGGVSDKVLMDAMHKLIDNKKYEEFILKAAKHYYLNQPKLVSSRRSVEEQRVEAFVAITGDLTLKIPTIQWLQIHSTVSKRSSFMYEYGARRSNPVTWYQYKMYEGPGWLRVGASHTDEIPPVFGFPYYNEYITETKNSSAEKNLREVKYTKQEKLLSRKLISIWTNFAKFGNPGREFDKFRYPVSQTYTRINYDGLRKAQYPLNDVIRLWTSLFSAAE